MVYFRRVAINGSRVSRMHANTWIFHVAARTTITDWWKKYGSDRYQFGLRRKCHVRIAPVAAHQDLVGVGVIELLESGTPGIRGWVERRLSTRLCLGRRILHDENMTICTEILH